MQLQQYRHQAGIGSPMLLLQDTPEDQTHLQEQSEALLSLINPG